MRSYVSGLTVDLVAQAVLMASPKPFCQCHSRDSSEVELERAANLEAGVSSVTLLFAHVWVKLVGTSNLRCSGSSIATCVRLRVRLTYICGCVRSVNLNGVRACVSGYLLNEADCKDRDSVVFIHISRYSTEWHTGRHAGWETTLAERAGGSQEAIHLRGKFILRRF